MIEKFSVAGSAHAAQDKANEDALYTLSGIRCTVIALADGVSTCSQAREGAKLVAESAASIVYDNPDYFLNTAPAYATHALLTYLLDRLNGTADKDGKAIEEYSSTLSVVLIDHLTKYLCAFHLGDGLILGAERRSCIILADPGKSTYGTCVTTTHGAEQGCRWIHRPLGALDRVAIFSDGAWKELFSRGKLNPDAKEAICCGNCSWLREYFNQQMPKDDYSMVMWNMDAKEVCK